MTRKLTELLMQLAARRSNTSWDEISLVVTDDEGIRVANNAYLKHDEPTDVVSLAFEPLPGVESLCGEIIVNAQRALEAAPAAHWDAAYELALYIAHGCDHITGEDDATPEQRQRMRRRELRWLKMPEIQSLIPNTITPREVN